MCNQRKNNSGPPLLHTQRRIQNSPSPLFGKSDHNSILLIPAYKQKLKQEAPVTRFIKKWSDEADVKLQDCFSSTDWNMFRDASNCIEEYTTSVICFINKCIYDIIPTVTVRTYPNQKPWITGNIRPELKTRAATFKERDSNPEAYKKSRCALWRTIKYAKRHYRTKIECYYTGSDARRMLQGVQTISGYKWHEPTHFLQHCYSLLSSMHSHFNNSTYMYILPLQTCAPAHWLCTGTPLYVASLLFFTAAL